MRGTSLVSGAIARRAWRHVANACLIATMIAGPISGAASAQTPANAPPRPPAPAPAAAPQSRPAASTPQERAADVKARGEKLRAAIRQIGVAEQTIKFECQVDPANPTCNGSGWIGKKLEVVNDRGPGVKGFHVIFWVPERDADKYRVDRERVVQERMKTSQEWDLLRPGAQSLFVSEKYYNRDFTYKDMGPAHAKVNGELMVCDVKISIFGEAMAPQTIKGPDGRPDPKATEAGARALGAQIQQEVKALAQALLPAATQASSCGPVEEAVAIPELPLVIPAAELEGTLKPALVAKKAEVVQSTETGKKERAKRTARGEDTQPLDTLRFLVNWHTESRGAIDAEERARAAAEAFFDLLARAYGQMVDAERAQVETGLLNRALALRRYRTVQRGLMRAKAGLGTIATTKDLETYYTAVSRSNWAEAELTALVRMAGPVNTARLGLYSNYDVWELGEPQANPQKVAAIEALRRRHIETLVDRGIVTVLGSEAQSEVLLEARKDRLFGLRDLWGGPTKEQGEAQRQVLTIWNRLGGVTGQLFSSGFGLFDVAAGVGADLSRGLYNLPGIGGQLQSRAEKLEKQAMDNWDKTQWKIVVLRLLRAKAPGDVRALGEQAIRLGRIDPAAVAQAIGKADAAAEVQALLEDRTFVDATDGGLHRIFGAGLVDLSQRGRIELMIAWEKTRLVQRDMEAALRVDQGQDPDTGDLTWGTILSPTGWMDVATKNKGVFWQKEGDDFRLRGAQINLKSQQGLDMTKLVAPLVQAEFDFEALPAEALSRHLQLWQSSGPYIAFVQRMREDRRARSLHAWRRGMPDAAQGGVSAAAIVQAQSLRKHYEEQLADITQSERLSEQRRIMDLAYADYVYAWDLSGALAVARKLEADPLYAQRYKLLVQTLYMDRAKQQLGSSLRNVGDIGFTTALMALTPYAGAQPASFGRFAYEAINPFAAAKGATWAQTAAHSARAVLTQSLTEVLVTDLGVPATGQKYEAALSQLVNLSLSLGPAALARQAEKLKALNLKQRVAEAVLQEQQRTPELDPKRHLAEMLGRELMKAVADVEASGERVARAKDLEAKTSLARQSRESTRLMLEGAEMRELAQRVQAARAALAAAREPAAAAAKLVETQRALENALRPPTREFYEWHLKNHPGEYFDPTRGRDIERLRSDFRKIRQMTRPEDRPALAQLEARIDQERVTRFNRALELFLASHGAQIEGVILNGTREGNPEYKGIFSDRDFTVVTKPGVSEAAIRRELDLAFAKHGIVLNGHGRLASADIEAMVQDALPGDVRPITTWREFETWALTRVNDPHRYLSGGGAEWVGLYNYLNGATVTLQGGRLVTDSKPNPKLLPAPELHPWLAWGLVLDLARFDAIVKPAELTDARSLADLIGARAKEVVRYSDALIWALNPDLLRARSPEAAKQRGYHNLLLDDVRRLALDGQITERELALIQRLVDVKTGKSIFQALGIDPSSAEANRGVLEATLADMDALVRRVSATTRQVYVEWLQRFARGVEDSERGPPALQTVAFRNWNAARKVDQQKLAVLMADTSGDPLGRMRREEQAVIGVGARLDTFDPAAQLGNSIREVHPPRPGNRERPAEGSEPLATPTALRTAATPVRPPAQVPALAELFVPKDSRAYTFRGDGHAYAAGQRVGTVKIPKGQHPHELVNEVVAFKLGRLLDANIPYAERVSDGGRVTVVTPDVPGLPLAAVLAGKDALGRPVPPPPAGLGPDGLKAQLRKDFVRDRLISAILGDARRDAGSYTVTPEARLVATDHEGARPFDAQDTVGHIAEEMRKRFEGEGYGKSGSTASQFRETDRALGVEIEQLAATWAEMKAKLLDGKGALRVDLLEPLAAYYGADKAKVLKAWQRRIRAMDPILGRVYLPNRRLAALDMNEAQFRAKDDAQRDLFVAAKWMRDAQQSMAQGLLEDIGAPTDSAYALLKREDFESFRDGILEKVHRKKYTSVAQMDDIARGRFNLPDADAVRRIVLEVEKAELFELVDGKTQGPKEREGVTFGYPRYHAIIRDKRTGLTFEWQIGTRMTTEFFEREGIDLHGVTLKEGMKPNIHDIEYDVFFYMQKSEVQADRDLATALGIPAFRKKVAQFSERTFLEAGTMPKPEFDRRVAELHAEASAILKELVARTSVAYVQGFFH